MPGDLYLDRYEGWYSVRDEAFYEEKELTEGEGGVEALAPGHAGRMDRRGDLVLPALQISAAVARSLRRQPDFIRPEQPPQRGGALRRGRADRSLRVSAPASIGACRCRVRRGMSCMSGSMR